MILSVFLAAATAVHSIGEFGAKPDGSRCTEAFAKAVAVCAEAGGGRVVVPAGTWSTGPIRLRSDIELHLEDGAVVEFSDDPKDYLPAVPSSWEGLECLNLSPLVYAYGCTNVAITGKGTLRPRMAFWREIMKEPKTDIRSARAILYKWGSEDYPVEKRDITKAHPAVLRPQCVQFNRCKGVRMEDVRIEDSPFWTIHLYMSEDVTIRRVDVCAHGFNNDGVDIEMTKNVLIEDSVFDQGDDGIVFKSGRNRDAWRVGRPTENVEVRNCRFKTVSSLIGVGSELSGGVRNVRVHDCTVENACNLFYVKTNHRRGGFVENVRMENVTCGMAAQVFAVDTDVLYQWRKLPDYETRVTPISGLHMKNVTCGCARTGVNINGDPRSPVRDVTLENVRISRVQDFLSRVENAENVDLGGLACTSYGKVATPWDKDYDPAKPPKRSGGRTRPLKVLMIGNSFSESVMAELPKAAAAYPGCELDIVNMMIGGCPLERHWSNVEKAATDPEFKPYFIDRSYASDKKKGKSLPRNANIPEMLVADRWDVVTIQQASPKSPFYETYQPYADKLIAKIRELAPQAEIRIQQTWSYTPYSGRLREWKMTSETMHVAVTNAYAQLAKKYGFKVIPTGDAVALYRAKLPVRYEKILSKAEIAAIAKPGTLDFHGDPVGSSAWKKGRKTEKDADEIKLRSDAIHLNAEGKYLQACVWLAALFDVDVTKLAYEPALKDFSSRAKLMRECAAEAVAGVKGK